MAKISIFYYSDVKSFKLLWKISLFFNFKINLLGFAEEQSHRPAASSVQALKRIHPLFLSTLWKTFRDFSRKRYSCYLSAKLLLHWHSLQRLRFKVCCFNFLRFSKIGLLCNPEGPRRCHAEVTLIPAKKGERYTSVFTLGKDKKITASKVGLQRQ